MAPMIQDASETQALSLGRGDPLEEGIAIHSSILAWWRRKWQPIPVFFSRESCGQRSLVGCCPSGRTQLKWLSMHACIGEGNGNPPQYSCLENPRDGGAWWAAVYGVTLHRTQLKRLSSHRSSSILAWRIPRTEESGGLWSIGQQTRRHDWSNLAHTQGCNHISHSGAFQWRFLVAVLNSTRGQHFQQRTHLGRQQLWTELTACGTAGDGCPCSCAHHSFSLWLASKWWRPADICYFTPHNSYSGAQDHSHKARQAGFLLILLVLIGTKLPFSNEALGRLLFKVSFCLQSG